MSTYSNLIVKDGPVAYYRLDETSGTVAHDQSGNNNNGTISASGITYAQAGAIQSDSDTALLLDGSHGHISVPGVSPVGWGQLTVEAWVKLSSNTFGHNATLWATGTTPNNTGDGFKFWIGANGVNGGFAVGVLGNRWAEATFSQTFTAGVWYHVAGVWDGAILTVYVNGVKNGASAQLSSGQIDDTGFGLDIGRDPQLPGDYFVGTLDEVAIYEAGLSAAKLQAHYAAGLAQVAGSVISPTNFLTAKPGAVLLLIDDVWYPTIRQETISIDRTANDPISTFTFTLQDDPSHIPLTELMEVVFLDVGQIPNPTHNLLQNPALSPYNSGGWSYSGHTGITASQNAGGGLALAFANAASGSSVSLAQTTQAGAIAAGQSYMASVLVQGSGSLAGFVAALTVNLLSPSGSLLSSFTTSSSPNPPASSLTQYSLAVTVPAGVAYVQVVFTATTTSGTNSGSVVFTQAQLEPMCFTSGPNQLSYPTPWCAPGQPNCIGLPDGTTVRQLRLFGGLITKATAGAYIGPNRQWQVTVSGYAWLLQKQLLNDSWTNTNDSDIINAIVTKYFAGVFSTAQVATGNAYQNTLAYTYDGTAQDAFDALAGNSNYLYYVDAYRIIWYQPPGYNTLPFELSDEPDDITSFEYYAYSRDIDASQIGNAVYVTGAQGIAATVFDAQSIGTYAQLTRNGSGIFWRTVNDSNIASTQAAIDRGIGEVGEYAYARPILHLTTNQFIIPCYTVLVTSRPDNLIRAPFLVQKATLVLSGFQSLMSAYYECQCDLGYFNPDLTNVLSRALRTVVKATTGGQALTSYWGPVPAVVPAIDVIATEQMQYRDSVQVTITSASAVAGVPTTWYGTAGAVYGSNLVGYA